MKRTKRVVSGFIIFCACLVNVQAKTIFIAPTGTSSSQNSTYDNPIGFDKLGTSMPTSLVVSGDTVYFLGGQYNVTRSFTLVQSGSNGTANKRTFLGSYPGETAVFDGRKLPYEKEVTGSDNIALKVPANFAHIRGIVVRYAGKNGFHITGSNNLLEACTAYANANTGIQLKGGGNNQVINCDSFLNFDYKTMNGDKPDYGGNADGFADKQYTSPAGTSNVYRGCRAWNNSDDGWDFYEHASNGKPSEIRDSWCFGNGIPEYDMTEHPRYETDKAYFETFRKGDKIIIPNLGNGNGFKVGGNKTKHDVIVSHCVAFGNKVKGFDQNNNGGSIEIYNCTAYENSPNYGFGNNIPGVSIHIKNCISYNTRFRDAFLSGYTHSHNNWDLSPALNITDVDFVGIDKTSADMRRLADGSLPDMDGLFRLSSNSQLIDKGINVGLPFYGQAPDLGAFEYDPNASSTSTPAIEEANVIAYPNPVKTNTTFTVILKEAAKVSLSLYNMRGERVYQTTHSTMEAGTHYLLFERNGLPSGVYLYQLNANGRTTGRHLILN